MATAVFAVHVRVSMLALSWWGWLLLLRSSHSVSLSSSRSLLQHSVISQVVVTNVSNHFSHSTSSPSAVALMVDEMAQVGTTGSPCRFCSTAVDEIDQAELLFIN